MTHHYSQRNPMTEARRQHLHGPLVSDLPPLRPVRELLGGAAVVAVFFVLIWGFAAMTPSDQETAKEALVGAQRAIVRGEG